MHGTTHTPHDKINNDVENAKLYKGFLDEILINPIMHKPFRGQF